jgi:DNA-binding NarL/FixJ family response regulator
MIRVLVEDDQPLVRSGLVMLLDAEPDVEIVGEAGDGAAAVDQARLLQPDVVIMDVRMPVMDGVEATRAVAAGDAWLQPAVSRDLLAEFANRPEPRAPRPELLARLTPRETEVLVHMARGLTNGQIAEKLQVGEVTVKTHVGRIFMKLDLRDRVRAVIAAYESGLVTPGQTAPSSQLSASRTAHLLRALAADVGRRRAPNPDLSSLVGRIRGWRLLVDPARWVRVRQADVGCCARHE